MEVNSILKYSSHLPSSYSVYTFSLFNSLACRYLPILLLTLQFYLFVLFKNPSFKTIKLNVITRSVIWNSEMQLCYHLRLTIPQRWRLIRILMTNDDIDCCDLQTLLEETAHEEKKNYQWWMSQVLGFRQNLSDLD